MRPISNVVDVTNYVMLALGNPLHAFDLAKLAGGRIVVRRAQPGETIRTLDGVERKLEPDDLMIADAERSVALAGIMGGEETEISDETTEVLLEAANFEPTGIFRTSERLRLRTEGSNRWEKGVDPYLAEPAANLATQLLVETAGATWAGDADVHDGLPERPVIRYRPERADELIGLETPAADQLALARAARLREPRRTRSSSPTWRARDVTREVDVVEEVARDAARRRAVHAAGPPRDVRRAHGRAAPAPADRGPARRARPDRDLHAVAAARRRESAGAPPARADLGRARRAAHEPAAEPRRGGAAQRRARRRATSRCSRSPASTSRRQDLPGRGDARRRDRRGRLVAREGDRRHALRRAQGRAELRARRARAAAPRQVGGDRGRRRRRAPPGRARRRLGRVRARPGEAARGRARGGALHRRRLVPAGPPGSRLRRAGGGERRRARRRRARGRGRGAARAAAVRRLPRRAGRARAASRSPSRRRSSRPSGRSPTRTRRSCASGSLHALRERFGAELRA